MFTATKDETNEVFRYPSVLPVTPIWILDAIPKLFRDLGCGKRGHLIQTPDPASKQRCTFRFTLKFWWPMRITSISAMLSNVFLIQSHLELVFKNGNSNPNPFKWASVLWNIVYATGRSVMGLMTVRVYGSSPGKAKVTPCRSSHSALSSMWSVAPFGFVDCRNMLLRVVAPDVVFSAEVHPVQLDQATSTLVTDHNTWGFGVTGWFRPAKDDVVRDAQLLHIIRLDFPGEVSEACAASRCKNNSSSLLSNVNFQLTNWLSPIC